MSDLKCSVFVSYIIINGECDWVESGGLVK